MKIHKSHFRTAGLRAGILGILAVCIVLLDGCTLLSEEMIKLRDLDFTILGEEKIPEQLMTIIEERKKEAFQITYTDNTNLYICIGYGEQETGGYSIQILDFYLTQNAVVFDTNLVGPSKDEVKNAAPSFPYLVVKTKNPDKNVIFQ